MAQVVKKYDGIWVYYLDRAFSDWKYAVVKVKGMMRLGHYTAFEAAKERAKAEEDKMKKEAWEKN